MADEENPFAKYRSSQPREDNTLSKYRRQMAVPPSSSDDSFLGGVGNFGEGLLEGIEGEGIPAGTASEFAGGRSGFGGRMLGTGLNALGAGIWEAIKTPGQYLSGEKAPGPQSSSDALSTALLMAGQGGRRPIVTEAPISPSALQGSKGVLKSQAGSGPNPFLPAEGGRVEPLPKEVPVIPPGLQPARPTSGTTTGPIPPGTPAAPSIIGGGPVKSLPNIPVIPSGPQPARPTSGAFATGPIRAGEPPIPPIVGGGAQAPSLMAQALAGNSAGAIDRQLIRTYRRSIKPRAIGQPSIEGLKTQDAHIMQAFDDIIANRRNLHLTDEAGNEIVGKLPRSLRQLSEAIGQTKRNVFHAYDQMAARAGRSGVQVDLSPAISKLREIANSPQVSDFHPAVREDALRLADVMSSRRYYTPSQTQDVIQNLNRTLAGFWKNPTHETVSRASLLAPISTILREQLDTAILRNGDPGYQALRLRYQALRSVERDVATAVQRNANKIPGGLPGMLADLAATEQLMHGILTINPEAVGRAAVIKSAKALLHYINEPNRAVARMFERRADRPLRQFYDRPAAAISGIGAGIGSQQGQ